MFEIHQDDFLNTAPCGFLIFSDEGIIETVNETLLTILNYRKEDLVHRKIENILTLANRIFYQTHLFPLIKLHGRADEIFLTFLTSDKKELHVLLNAKRKMHGDCAYNHCILMPVHERRKFENELLLARKTAEDALQKNNLLIDARELLEHNKQEMDRQVSKLKQLNRELVQYSKVISHDIQEPIRKISIFADIALKQSEMHGYPDLKDALDKIRFACHRMRRLVNSLEQYISLEAFTDRKEKADLDKLVTKAAGRALKTTGYTGEFNLETIPLPVISASAKQMELLFFNVIENAIKFRQPGKAVNVKVDMVIYQENSYKSLPESYHYRDVVKISFSDNGNGFETEYGNNLFKLFQRLQTDEFGTGLGLALCKKVVDNHYGEISLDSHPLQGTRVDITLPVIQ